MFVKAWRKLLSLLRDCGFAVLCRTPLFQSFSSFSLQHHKVAFSKFIALWVLSLLPGIFSLVLLSKESPRTVLGQINAAFTPAEQFVYAVSFLSPMLYLVWERLQQHREYIAAKRRTPELLAIVPRGFGPISLVTLVLFIYTAFAFGAAKAWQEAHVGSFERNAAIFAVTSSLWVYLYGVFCWYLAILMSVEAEAVDFVTQTRREETAMQQAFGKRIAEKGAE